MVSTMVRLLTFPKDDGEGSQQQQNSNRKLHPALNTTTDYIQGDYKKYTPLRLLLILALHGSFWIQRHTTVNKIYTSSSFVEILLLRPRNSPFSAFWASCKTGYKRTVTCLLRISGHQTLQIWTNWTTTFEASCWKSNINTSWSLRNLTKVALQTVWEELPQQHQQDGGELYQALDCLRRGCQWWCSNSVRLQVCILISSPITIDSLKSHQQTTGEDNARNTEKWGLSGYSVP